MYGTFVAVFSKTSELNMTKQEGATVAAVFWGSFAAFRCVAIFLSLKLKSIHLISARYGPLRTYAFSPVIPCNKSSNFLFLHQNEP